MDTVRLQNELADCSIVDRFYSYESLDSTMLQARRLLKESGAAGCDKTLLLADYQTAGRGRNGRVWVAPAAASILATLILSLPGLPEYNDQLQFSHLAAAIPVAVCKGIIPFVPDARIKYPNDIVAGGRKLGGILLEIDSKALIIGFGVNVLQEIADVPPDARIPASSVFLETGKLYPRETVLMSILTEMEQILSPDRFSNAVSEMNALCETLASVVCVDVGSEVLVGLADSIDTAGRLVIKTESRTVPVSSSDIMRLWPADKAYQ